MKVYDAQSYQLRPWFGEDKEEVDTTTASGQGAYLHAKGIYLRFLQFYPKLFFICTASYELLHQIV